MTNDEFNSGVFAIKSFEPDDGTFCWAEFYSFDNKADRELWVSQAKDDPDPWAAARIPATKLSDMQEYLYMTGDDIIRWKPE